MGTLKGIVIGVAGCLVTSCAFENATTRMADTVLGPGERARFSDCMEQYLRKAIASDDAQTVVLTYSSARGCVISSPE